MKKILIYCDTKPEDLSCVGAVELMVDEEVSLTAIGYKEHCPSGNSVYDEILLIDDHKVMPYDTMNLCDLITENHQEKKYDIILFPSTQLGRILAPRVAIALHVGLVADVTDLHLNHGIIEMIRPAYSGKLLAHIEALGTGPLMMSVRPGVFQPKAVQLKSTNIRELHGYQPKPSQIILLQTRLKPSTEDIRDSKILISGGGGVLEHFDHLEELATLLNAQVSASRRVVDSGIVSRRIQVGQSGKTVSPKLYIALGISGSVQHIEGLKNVETIIAVNTNKNAPICSLATLVVEGDAVDFIDKLSTKIKKNSLNFKEETQ
jgi:electron transfer flavoprotein alpha subunit